jgi:uncharacterized membrane protein YedE/YeeE
MNISIFAARWNPYVAGALTGILAILSVAVTTLVIDKSMYLGASTTFVRAAGYVEQVVIPENVETNEYLKKNRPRVDWQMMVVAGIFIGALISARLGRSAKLETVPPIWKERFGTSATLRGIGAFIGGMILMFGARLADGCPSGHGLSGNMQLAVSGLLALVFFMVGGIITAHLLYKK